MSILGNVAGLGAVQPDWSQTDAARADFIRNKPDLSATAEALDALRSLAEGALPRSGGTMEGALELGGFRIGSLGEPEAAADAATKGYVDAHSAAFLTLEAELTAEGWTGESGGPYTQRIYAPGITDRDRPHYGLVYTGDRDSRLLQKRSFAAVDDLDTETDNITFTCLEEKPQTALKVQLEVAR